MSTPENPDEYLAQRVASLENQMEVTGNLITSLQQQLAAMSEAIDAIDRQANRAENTANQALASAEEAKYQATH